MEIKTEKEYERSVRRADVYVDSSAEYVIPDYNGDIRKLLLTDAQVRPAGKFASGGEIEFSGVVLYNVVYCDPEGKISSTSFTSDYEYKVKCSEEGYKDAVSEARVANLSVRLLGPRKISVKASVVGSVTLCESERVSVSGSAFSIDETPEIVTETVNVRRTVSSEPLEREYAETVVSIDGAIADEVRVIYSGAEVDINETELREGSVRVNGEMTLFAVIENGDVPAYIAERKIDISEDIPFEDVNSGMSLTPYATVVSLKDAVNATDTGCDVVLSAIVEYSLVADENTETELISDAYLKSCVTENVYDDFIYSEFVSSVKTRSTVTLDASREELGCEHLREVVLLSPSVKISDVEVLDDSVKVAGEVKINGIASELSDDGKTSYIPIKFSTEFSENVNLGCQIDEKTQIQPTASVLDVSASIDASRVYVSADVKINLTVTQERSVRVLSSCEARVELPFEKHPARVNVYYPDGDETLFSVAKKFHTTAQKVALDNSLSVAVSADGKCDTSKIGVKKLIIF